MDSTDTAITIISDQKVRAESLKALVNNALNRKVYTSAIITGEIYSYCSVNDKQIFLLDLMGCYQPSRQLINSLFDILVEGKIIALHMYRSFPLIQPLLAMGIHGYLYYEPTREEILHAVNNVQKNELYLPPYITAQNT